MTKKLRKGDLVLIEITEHVDDPKRYAIIGRFKGSNKKHVFARIGEGADDPRPAELIKLTAERVGATIGSLYATMAHSRDIQESEVADRSRQGLLDWAIGGGSAGG